MVAHELRSPIGGAQSLLRTLLAGMAGELSPPQADALLRVEDRLSGLKIQVDDLLFLASAKNIPASQQLKPIDLTKILNTAVNHFTVEAQDQGVALSFSHPSDSVYALGTRDGYAKIFSNLISNAVKYTPKGGRVQIILDTDREQISVEVKDTGIGIPEQSLAKIGEEFFRAHNARQSEISGTGLGLSIVLQIVAQFDGVLTIESVEGQGSRFRLQIPVADKNGE